MPDHRAAKTVVYNPGKGEFLLVKRAETKETDPGKWEFPGGGVEDDETPKQAALRELEEETDLKGKIIRTGDSGSVELDRGVLEIHPFLAVVRKTDVDLSREHSDYKWMKKERIDELDTVIGVQKELEALDIES